MISYSNGRTVGQGSVTLQTQEKTFYSDGRAEFRWQTNLVVKWGNTSLYIDSLFCGESDQ